MSQSGGSGGGGGSQDPSSSQPGSQRKIQYTQLEEDMIRDALKVGLTINQPNQIARFIYNRRAEPVNNVVTGRQNDVKNRTFNLMQHMKAVPYNSTLV